MPEPSTSVPTRKPPMSNVIKRFRSTRSLTSVGSSCAVGSTDVSNSQRAVNRQPVFTRGRLAKLRAKNGTHNTAHRHTIGTVWHAYIGTHTHTHRHTGK